MEGPPLGPGGEDITWPDQVAPRGRKASSTRKIKPQTSNLSGVRPGPTSRWPWVRCAGVGARLSLARWPVPRFVVCFARVPGSRHPVAVVAWHLSLCRGCGRWGASVACLVAPRWCAAPRPVRSLFVLRLAFLSPWCLPSPRGLSPPAIYWVAARGTWRPAENPAHCACRWPLPRQGRWARSASYPFGAPRWACPWRVPPASVLGFVRCGGSACVDPLTDASSFPYRPSFDGGLGRCTRAAWCGRRHRPFRVGGRHAQVARVCVCVLFLAGSGGPASWSRFDAPHLSFGRSWCALCLFGPLRAGVAPFVVVVRGFFFFFFLPFPPPSPLLSPPCVLLCVFSGPGCLGPWRLVPPPFLFPPPPPSVRPFVSCFSCFPASGALGLGLLLPPPFFLPAPPCCLWRFLISGCLGPLRPTPPPFFFSLLFFFCRLCGAGRVCASWAVRCARVCVGGAVPVIALCALAGVVWCWLLGLAVLCCLPVGLGVVLRWCCPCLAAWLAALWFGVVCPGVPLPCVVFCCAVLSCGGVLSCSAICLRRCLCLLFVSCSCASAVCVLACCAVCSLSSPPCAVLCCAVLVPFRCAVRVVCAVPGGWCCWFPVSLSFVGGLLVALVARRCRLVVCVGFGARVWSGCRSASSLWCPAPLCCVLWRCAAVWFCAVVPCLFFFVFLLAGAAGFLLFPVGSGLRAGSRSFLFLCSACAVLCWCACVVALCSVLSCPRGAGWCFVLLPSVFVCLLLGLAVLCCLLVGPGGSCCPVSVACCDLSLGAVLRRVAARCAAWRCVVVRCVVLFCSVWCCRALCCVLGRCPSSWGPVPSGAVFCLVPPRCVCFAVVCCHVVSFAVVLCAVCALRCRVMRLLLYLLEKPLQNFVKCFFPFFFLAFEKKKKLYTTQHTRVQQDHVCCSVLRATRCSCCSWPCTCVWRRGARWCPLLRVDRVPPGPPPELQGKGSDGHEGGEGGAWRRRRKRRQGATRGVVASYETFSSFTRCSRRVFLCAYSELHNRRDGVRVLRALRCLQRYLFTYFTSKHFSSRFYAFCSGLFGLSDFYAN